MGAPPVLIHFRLGFYMTKNPAFLGSPMTSWKPPYQKWSLIHGDPFEWMKQWSIYVNIH